MKTITSVAPINIAVIKYWGKRNESLILPLNSSLSATLDSCHMCAKTTVATDGSFKEDKLWLNGKEIDIKLNPRYSKVLKEIRARARNTKTETNPDWKIHICSENNFPTAAGLASSAAGFACLVYSLSALFNIKSNTSDIARLGSGSACRSMYGGFVEWEKGVEEDGKDSLSKQICPSSYWKDLRVVIAVVQVEKKHTPSTKGMNQSTMTSSFLKFRASKLVEENLIKIKEAIKQKDFNTFAQITMKDSNNMHSTCLDTFPPILYLNSTSLHLINLIHSVNDFYKTNKFAYTFDAGPNSCIFCLKEDLSLLISLLTYFYGNKKQNDENNYDKNDKIKPEIEGKKEEEEIKFRNQFVKGITFNDYIQLNDMLLEKINISPSPGSLLYLINTKVGDGPQLLANETLIDKSTGLPLNNNNNNKNN